MLFTGLGKVKAASVATEAILGERPDLIVNYGSALNIRADDASLRSLEGIMDEVKHQVLPTRGFLLTMTKRLH